MHQSTDHRYRQASSDSLYQSHVKATFPGRFKLYIERDTGDAVSAEYNMPGEGLTSNP